MSMDFEFNQEKKEQTYNKETKRKYYLKNKEAISEREKKRYENNREKRLEQNRKWRESNTEKLRRSKKLWREKNYMKVKEYLKQWHKDNPEYNKQWNKNNPEKVKIQKKKHYIKHNIEHKINGSMKKSLKGVKEGRNWGELVDYNKNILVEHLKSTLPKGYTWQDFLEGRLQIDHIIPIRAFNITNPDDEEFKQCWSLYNLRLLTKEENISKHERINPILLGLLTKGYEV